MPQLIIDSSTDFFILGLTKGSDLLADNSYRSKEKVSQTCLLEIVDFLKKHDLKVKDLESIAIGVGPGAFTGVRIAASIAKGLGFGADIALKPYTSLLNFIPEKVGPFTIITDAKGKCYYKLDGVYNADDTISYQKTELIDNTTLLEGNVYSPDPDLCQKNNWQLSGANLTALAKLLPSLDFEEAKDITINYLRHP